MSDAGAAPDAVLPLAGVRVLVTRPAEQAERLCAAIEADGGRAVRFPVFEIVPATNLGPARAAVERIGTPGIAIFVSANAVRYGLELIESCGRTLAAITVIAVGRATAEALAAHGATDVVYPAADMDSEGLLELPALAPQAVLGRDVVIFRGSGGRELLAQELLLRGARVEYAEVYLRQPSLRALAEVVPDPLREGPHITLATSGEALQRLADLARNEVAGWLFEQPLLVIGRRLQALAPALGFRRSVMVADEASDIGILRTLREWWCAARGTE